MGCIKKRKKEADHRFDEVYSVPTVLRISGPSVLTWAGCKLCREHQVLREVCMWASICVIIFKSYPWSSLKNGRGWCLRVMGDTIESLCWNVWATKWRLSERESNLSPLVLKGQWLVWWKALGLKGRKPAQYGRCVGVKTKAWVGLRLLQRRGEFPFCYCWWYRSPIRFDLMTWPSLHKKRRKSLKIALTGHFFWLLGLEAKTVAKEA